MSFGVVLPRGAKLAAGVRIALFVQGHLAPITRRVSPREGILTRISSDGLRILVGRSKEANDEVTFRRGRGRDWWFHVQGLPGAHVIVQSPGGTPLPPRTIREAAWLAGYYSPRRSEGRLDIDFTQRKHVRKVKGGQPGQVTYSQNRTVVADMNDPDAARILDAVEGGEGRRSKPPGKDLASPGGHR